VVEGTGRDTVGTVGLDLVEGTGREGQKRRG
jgi:hypothetical protein